MIIETIPKNVSQKISFQSDEGYQLSANLELPKGEPLAYALFAHCFTCSKDSLAAFRISKALTQFGIAVLRFDFTGLGGSEGDFSNSNFSGNVEDLLSAAHFLAENYQAPSLLIGHSLGAAAVLTAVATLPQVKAVVSIAAPDDLEHIKTLFADKVDEINQQKTATVVVGGRTFTIKSSWLKDLEKYRLKDIVAKIKQPLLFFHSLKDKIVKVENGYNLFQAATSAKSFIGLEDADHLLSKKEDAAYVANILAAWAVRYIATIENKEKETSENLPLGKVIVQESGLGKYAEDVIVNHHHLIADEPLAAGGNDLGPGPYDLLLAALGACTAMTVRYYADFKKIPLEKVVVQLSYDKIYAQDCINCEDEKSMLDHINRWLELQGNLTEEQRNKLLEIANKCPVHRTLTSKILIDTKLI